jgi:hypothetical protein
MSITETRKKVLQAKQTYELQLTAVMLEMHEQYVKSYLQKNNKILVINGNKFTITEPNGTPVRVGAIPNKVRNAILSYLDALPASYTATFDCSSNPTAAPKIRKNRNGDYNLTELRNAVRDDYRLRVEHNGAVWVIKRRPSKDSHWTDYPCSPTTGERAALQEALFNKQTQLEMSAEKKQQHLF